MKFVDRFIFKYMKFVRVSFLIVFEETKGTP